MPDRCVTAHKNGLFPMPAGCPAFPPLLLLLSPVAPAPRVLPALPSPAALAALPTRASLADAISERSPLPCILVNEVIKRGGCFLRPPQLLTSIRGSFLGGSFPRCSPRPSSSWRSGPVLERTGVTRRHLPLAPMASGACPSWGQGGPYGEQPDPEHPDPAAARGSVAGAGAGPGALLCMDGAAFWVMKYSQVSDSLRNDGISQFLFRE